MEAGSRLSPTPPRTSIRLTRVARGPASPPFTTTHVRRVGLLGKGGADDLLQRRPARDDCATASKRHTTRKDARHWPQRIRCGSRRTIATATAAVLTGNGPCRGGRSSCSNSVGFLLRQSRGLLPGRLGSCHLRRCGSLGCRSLCSQLRRFPLLIFPDQLLCRSPSGILCRCPCSRLCLCCSCDCACLLELPCRSLELLCELRRRCLRGGVLRFEGSELLLRKAGLPRGGRVVTRHEPYTPGSATHPRLRPHRPPLQSSNTLRAPAALRQGAPCARRSGPPAPPARAAPAPPRVSPPRRRVRPAQPRGH